MRHYLPVEFCHCWWKVWSATCRIKTSHELMGLRIVAYEKHCLLHENLAMSDAKSVLQPHNQSLPKRLFSLLFCKHIGVPMPRLRMGLFKMRQFHFLRRLRLDNRLQSAQKRLRQTHMLVHARFLPRPSRPNKQSLYPLCRKLPQMQQPNSLWCLQWSRRVHHDNRSKVQKVRLRMHGLWGGAVRLSSVQGRNVFRPCATKMRLQAWNVPVHRGHRLLCLQSDVRRVYWPCRQRMHKLLSIFASAVLRLDDWKVSRHVWWLLLRRQVEPELPVVSDWLQQMRVGSQLHSVRFGQEQENARCVWKRNGRVSVHSGFLPGPTRPQEHCLSRVQHFELFGLQWWENLHALQWLDWVRFERLWSVRFLWLRLSFLQRDWLSKVQQRNGLRCCSKSVCLFLRDLPVRCQCKLSRLRFKLRLMHRSFKQRVYKLLEHFNQTFLQRNNSIMPIFLRRSLLWKLESFQLLWVPCGMQQLHKWHKLHQVRFEYRQKKPCDDRNQLSVFVHWRILPGRNRRQKQRLPSMRHSQLFYLQRNFHMHTLWWTGRVRIGCNWPM